VGDFYWHSKLSHSLTVSHSFDIIPPMARQTSEIIVRTARLVEAADAAINSQRLIRRRKFDWVSGEVRHPMKPQPILSDSDTLVDFYRDYVAVYADGHINAQIHEPSRRRHQSGKGAMPVPYITRLLDVKDGVLTVDTPTVREPSKREPAVTEESHYYGASRRFRVVTVFDTKSGSLTAETGNLVGDGSGGIFTDERTKVDLAGFSRDIKRRRLATVIRTLDAATTVFEEVARQEKRVKVTVG
jgi:hypothetical protein